jgi:hypothetical protein
MEWTHESVFQALAKLFPVTLTVNCHFVCLFAPQKPQCACLYAPDSKKHSDFPLHLHPGKKSWKPDKYLRIIPAIGTMKLEGSPHRRPPVRWIRCKVDDWNALASALGLEQEKGI